jgi:hypothetical protein
MFYGGLRRGVGRRLRSSAHRVGCRRAWQRRRCGYKTGMACICGSKRGAKASP